MSLCSKGHTCLFVDFASNVFFLNFWYRLQSDIVLRRCYLGVFSFFFWDTRHAVGLVTLGIGYVRSVPNLLLLLRSES